MPTPSQIIAIAGPSSSGKSCLAEALVRRLGRSQCQWVALDHYYRDLRHLSVTERALCDFDCPAAWESELIVDHVAQWKKGLPVTIPQYDFATHLRSDFTAEIPAAPVIVIEGLFALCYAELNALVDLAVFVDVDDQTALARRIERDVKERGRTLDSVLAQYEATVQPAVERYIRPSAAAASIRLQGTIEARQNVDRILAQLADKPS